MKTSVSDVSAGSVRAGFGRTGNGVGVCARIKSKSKPVMSRSVMFRLFYTRSRAHWWQNLVHSPWTRSSQNNPLNLSSYIVKRNNNKW